VFHAGKNQSDCNAMRCEGMVPLLSTRKKTKRTYGIDFIASCNSVPLAIVIPFKDIGGGGVGLKIERRQKLKVD
jgi:hypothetical protein